MISNCFIICPNCGRQYLPGEIYDPVRFCGRKAQYKVVDEELQVIPEVEQELNSEYICDSCDTLFQVQASVKVKVHITKEIKRAVSPQYHAIAKCPYCDYENIKTWVSRHIQKEHKDKEEA